MSIVKVDLRNKNAVQLYSQAGRVLTAIKSSPYFSEDEEPVVRLRLLNTELGKTLQMGKGNTQQLAERNNAAQNVANAYRCLAGYVQSHSEGDETIILSTGYNVRKGKTIIGLLPAPVIKRSVKLSYAGCIKLMWQANTLAKMYKVYIKELDTDKPIEFVTHTTRCNAIIQGLESAKKYVVYVSCSATAGESPLSNGIVVCEAWL